MSQTLSQTTCRLIDSKPYFSAFVPGPISVVGGVAGKVGTYVMLGWKIGRNVYEVRDIVQQARDGHKASVIVGNALGTTAIWAMSRPTKRYVGRKMSYMSRVRHDPFRKNGMGGRSWYEAPRREKLVIVYHDANRAGPHIDVHIGRLSLVYRVKPDLQSQLKYNSSGILTENSRKAILEYVRGEIANNSRVAQNLDHSRSNAVASWTFGDRDATHYGAGYTRQVVLETEVDIYKAHLDGPIEMYAPAVYPHRSLYLYRLYNGDRKRAPICIWGRKTSQPPKLQDRLHLKLTHPEDVEVLDDRADMRTSTAKYDGSSCYVVITPKGTTVWSPRTSVKTGDQIEYTFKLDGIAQTTSDQTIVAMGELLFKRKGQYLSSAEGSGILNSNQVLPKDVTPEIRLYRVDRVGRKTTYDLPFWENRQLQKDTAKLHKRLKVVELMEPGKAHERGFEGVVVVPEDGSVNDGFKVKWWDDPNDWRIDQVAFKRGPKGNVAGVVHATSLDSGKKFKLGPGQVGDRELTEHMMENPELYEGVVIKVNSKRGHEGRASKIILHDDKGLAPV